MFGKEIETTTKVMQKTLDGICNWSEKTGFEFSKQKFEFMGITRKKLEKELKLFLENSLSSRKRNLKTLGLIFDEKLSWTPHIKNLKTDCIKRLNIIKSIASTKYGADNSILKIYRSIILTKIDGNLRFSQCKHSQFS